MTKRRMNRDFDTETGVFTFNIDDGAEKVELKTSDLSEEMRSNLIGSGINQTVGDSVASLTKDGSAKDVAEGLKKRWQTLVDGNWSARTGGGGGTRITLLAEAIAQVKGAKVEDVVAKLAELSDDGKKALRKNSQVIAVMAQIKAKRATDAAKKAGKAASGDKTALVF